MASSIMLKMALWKRTQRLNLMVVFIISMRLGLWWIKVNLCIVPMPFQITLSMRFITRPTTRQARVLNTWIISWRLIAGTVQNRSWRTGKIGQLQLRKIIVPFWWLGGQTRWHKSTTSTIWVNKGLVIRPIRQIWWAMTWQPLPKRFNKESRNVSVVRAIPLGFASWCQTSSKHSLTGTLRVKTIS